MKKQIKRLTKIIFVLSVIILLSNYSIINHAKGKTFNEVYNIPKNKVGLLLGTSKYVKSGRINLYFKYRVDAAVKLFKNGKIDFILVSGDNGELGYDEPTQFKEELIKNGIPKERIYLDYAGFRTLDSVIRAKEIFGQESITIISQKFHNERAIYLAQVKGINAIGFNAKDVNKRYGFRTMIREYLARTKALFDVVFKVKPKYLGKKVVIS